MIPLDKPLRIYSFELHDGARLEDAYDKRDPLKAWRADRNDSPNYGEMVL